VKTTLHLFALSAALVITTGPGHADTIYHCGYKNGAAVYKIMNGNPGPGCRAINRPRKPGRRIPGAKCRSQRYGDTIMHCCDKDGIRRCYNTNSSSHAKRAAAGRKKIAGVDKEARRSAPATTENVYAVSGDMTGIIERASKQYSTNCLKR